MMEKLMKLGRNALAAALAVGALSGAPAEAAPVPDGMAALREAVLTPAKPDRRVFVEDLLFFSPSLRADLEFLGQARKHDARIAGHLNIVATDEKGDTNPLEIPFYIAQTNRTMILYFNLGEKWQKFTTPSLAAAAMDVTVTPTEEEANEQLALVKEATVLRETPTQRTLLVKLDGNKAADLVRRYSDQHPADNGTANDAAFQEAFLRYLDQGLRRAECWYIWTIDKTDWQTITMTYHLSPILQETARAALAEEHPSWPAEFTQMVETLAYYSELKTYTTFLNPDAKDKADIPDEVWKNAEPVNDLFASEKAAK